MIARLATISPCVCCVLAICVHVAHTALGFHVEGLEQILLAGVASR